MAIIKVVEATELQLDWLVARIEGDELPKAGSKGLDYSTDWACGGPIIEKNCIDVCFIPREHAPFWSAYFPQPKSYKEPWHRAHGPTPLIAAMRCFCCSKLGDVVDIPEELCQRQNS